MNTPQRIISVDAYRGFVMLLMMSEILRLGKVSEALPDSLFWALLSWNQTHVPWVGGTLHDLIQPSFSFLVGVALPFSMASRSMKGQSSAAMWGHTLKRSLILILLGIFLRSMHRDQTNFTFEDTLTQIGLGYPFLFALGFAGIRMRLGVLAGILLGYWLLFALYPLPGSDFDWSQTGITPDWNHFLTGFEGHWNKNVHPAWAFDRWFLNLFPREEHFLFNRGGYVTLSFIPTLATMILGLIAGQLLRNYHQTEPGVLMKKLLWWGLGLFIAAMAVSLSGICPIVKRIWTPSWVLYSGAWCFCFLAIFYYLIDVLSINRGFYLLFVIGANSIAAYVLADGFAGFISSSLKTHLGASYPEILGAAYASLVSGGLILAIEIAVLVWMFKKKIFIKI